MHIIIKYAVQNQQYIKKHHDDAKHKTTIEKVVSQLSHLIPKCDFKNEELGGNGKIVQIDETMLNYELRVREGDPLLIILMPYS